MPELEKEELTSEEKFVKYFGKEKHKIEVVRDQVITTNYPQPVNSYYMVYENFNLAVEPLYFWALNHLGDLGFPVIDKIEDVFTASQHSSFYGAAGQRLGLAQDKVSSFLATIGKMVRDLFQIVRELRWIDERIGYYENAGLGEDKKWSESAEVGLKGLWVDLVDGVVGGNRTPANVLSMAQQLNFIALPDLFFAIHPKKTEDIDGFVEDQAKEYNSKVRYTLKRKLFAYLRWKESTYKEIKSRRTWTIKYLRQQYHVIQMYTNWVKPYLKNVEKLQTQTTKLDVPSLISSFEGSLIDIEILARTLPKGNKKYFSCILFTINYRTKPSLSFTKPTEYHRGPVHVGESRITWRAYAWTEEQIEKYKELKQRENLELLSVIDDQLKDAMEALDSDLYTYLKEANTLIEKKKVKVVTRPKQKLHQPLLDSIRGVHEVWTSLRGGFKDVKDSFRKKESSKDNKEKKAAEKTAAKMCFVHYENFKKKHRLLTW
jgi:hypothetical protein